MKKKGSYIISILIAVGFLAIFITALAIGGTIIGSRHDLTGFNKRAFGTPETGPMTGASFNNYKQTCIYCHTPHNANNAAPLWNRQLPEQSGYQMYGGPNFDSKPGPAPDGISLACLSCHDGSVAVDSIRVTPKDFVDTGTHYRMTEDGPPGSDSCGKCHNRTNGAYGGIVNAHDATIRYLSKDLRDDHPISMSLPTRDMDPQFNQPTILKDDGGRMFPNGVQTFEGDKVQCASCHDPHNPDERNTEGRDPFLRTSNKGSALCLTCHAK